MKGRKEGGREGGKERFAMTKGGGRKEERKKGIVE